jgi:hypothetical protein
MWPFKKKNKYTIEEFANFLMITARDSTKNCSTNLQDRVKENWALSPEEIEGLTTEIFIAHLWIISHTFSSNKQILNLLHDSYLSGYHEPGLTEQEDEKHIFDEHSKLLDRYEKYYKAWGKNEHAENGFLPVAFEMSQCFFPKRKPVLDIFMQVEITTHLTFFVESAFKIWEKSKIGE